jgi:hypothetical protein
MSLPWTNTLGRRMACSGPDRQRPNADQTMLARQERSKAVRLRFGPFLCARPKKNRIRTRIRRFPMGLIETGSSAV